MSLGVHYTVEREAIGHPDKPYVGRFKGVWVASASSEIQAQRLLFQFHNRRLNREAYPNLVYMVRTPDGQDYYPSADLDECRTVADSLFVPGRGHGYVVRLAEVEHEVIMATDDIVYRAEGSTPGQLPTHRVVCWKHVPADSLRIGDDIELAANDYRDSLVYSTEQAAEVIKKEHRRRYPVHLRITGWSGRPQFAGRTPEMEVVNFNGEPTGYLDLPAGSQVVLVLDRAIAEATHLHTLYRAATALTGAGLLDEDAFDRIMRHVQGEKYQAE